MKELAVGIVHARHLPERGACFERLWRQVAVEQVPDYVADRRASRPIEWAEDVWDGTLQAAGRRGCSHAMFLNDDVVLSRRFWHHLKGALAVYSRSPVWCLHLPHQSFAECPHDGLAESLDGMVGPAYLWRVDAFEDFLRFRQEDLRPVAAYEWPEDAQMATYCLATRTPILHTVPALIDVDATVSSNYGHDGDPYARPFVPPDDGVEYDWGRAPFLVGRCYPFYHWTLITHLTPAAKRKYGAVQKAYALDDEPFEERLPYNTSDAHCVEGSCSRI